MARRVLCVAEKPAIARSISEILSGGQYNARNTANRYIKNYDFDYPKTNSSFTVTSVSGHLMGLDFPVEFKTWDSCDPFTLFDMEIEKKVVLDKQTIEQNLIQEARRTHTLMIWTDCDQEGENIGDEVASVCRKANKQIAVKRARFSAIIAQQIHYAAQNPVLLDMGQVHAVEARRILDLRLGAAFTRMQTLNLQRRLGGRLNKMISYGPCQFPTLGFVVSRFNQVKAFVPEQFWYIFLSTVRSDRTDHRQEVALTWRRGHCFDFDIAANIYEGVMDSLEQNILALVTKITKKETKKWKPLPLTTVELQKSGSRLLKLAPKAILDISERLYQKGFLSYPRTETDQFDPQFDFMSLIQKQTVDPAWGNFATSLQHGEFSKPRHGKKNDQAHPPIHPTAHAGNLSGDEKRVYEFVTRRFLACCSKDALGFQTTVDVVCGQEEFYATGLIVLERNYLEVYPYDKWSTHELPDFHENETFKPSACKLLDGNTTRPALLTEADLVSLMDKNGIGTDATIAQHIATIVDRGYVVERMDGSTKHLVPSTLGIGLVEGYNDIDFEKSLSKPQLRRQTEWNMMQVCNGSKTKNDMLSQAIMEYKDIYTRAKNGFEKVVTSVQRRLDAAGDDIGEGGGGNNEQDGGGDNGGGRGGRGRGRGRGRGGGRGGASAGGGNRGARQSDLDGSGVTDDDYEPPLGRSKQNKPSSTTTKPRSKAAHPAVPDSVLLCKCNIPAIEQVKTEEGSSKGKKFWACGDNRRCSYFQWSDGPSSEKLIPAKRTVAERSWADTEPKADDSSGSGPIRRSTTYSSSGEGFGGSGSNNCFKCNKPGHWLRDCPGEGPSKPKRSKTFGAKNSNVAGSDVCFRCGGLGHWSNACPNQGKPSHDSQPEFFKSEHTKSATKARRTSSTRDRKGGRAKKSKFSAADEW